MCYRAIFGIHLGPQRHKVTPSPPQPQRAYFIYRFSKRQCLCPGAERNILKPSKAIVNPRVPSEPIHPSARWPKISINLLCSLAHSKAERNVQQRGCDQASASLRGEAILKSSSYYFSPRESSRQGQSVSSLHWWLSIYMSRPPNSMHGNLVAKYYKGLLEDSTQFTKR